MKWIFSVVIVAAMLSSCRHDPVIEPVAELNTVSGTLRLHVVPEWEGAPLALFSEYTNVSNYRTTVELLKMYFSEIELASVNGSVPVTDIELFNLDGPKQAEWSVPVGTYTALYAGLGVPEDLNHTDPSVYPVDHPLGINSATYWTWNSGYRFVMFEGRYDPRSAEHGSVNEFIFDPHRIGYLLCLLELDPLHANYNNGERNYRDHDPCRCGSVLLLLNRNSGPGHGECFTW
ncbi:MAG: hypothetical protein IPI91_14425 [Flavobacteriales bacterium]|nr:hypothetical protein [Flavobacteriales bacterium]